MKLFILSIILVIAKTFALIYMSTNRLNLHRSEYFGELTSSAQKTKNLEILVTKRNHIFKEDDRRTEKPESEILKQNNENQAGLTQAETRKSIDSHSSVQNLKQTNREFVEQLDSFGSEIAECLKIKTSLLCHLPVKLKLEAFLTLFEVAPVSVQENPKIQTMISNISYVINILEKNRNQTCVDNMRQQSVCLEEEEISYDPRTNLVRRLEAMEDELTAIVTGDAEIKPNLRAHFQFDTLANQLKDTTTHPGNPSRVEELVKTLSGSFDQLEKIRKDFCENNSGRKYCSPTEEVLTNTKSGESLINLKKILKPLLQDFRLCKKAYAENPSCYLPLKTQFLDVVGQWRITSLESKLTGEIEDLKYNIAHTIRRIEKVATKKCLREGKQEYCGGNQETQNRVTRPEVHEQKQPEREIKQSPETYPQESVNPSPDFEELYWTKVDPVSRVSYNNYGRDTIHNGANFKTLRKNFAKGVNKKLHEINTELMNCLDSNGVDFERYFIARKRFNDLTAKLDEYRILIRHGSNLAKVFENSSEKLWKIEHLSKSQCSEKGTLDDVCLHFNVSAYNEEITKFSDMVKAKLKLLIFTDPTEKEISELTVLLERSKILYIMGETYFYAKDETRQFVEKLENLQQMLLRKIAQAASPEEYY